MYQEAVMVPMGDWAKSRLRNLSESNKMCDDSTSRSGFGENIANWVGRDIIFLRNCFAFGN